MYYYYLYYYIYGVLLYASVAQPQADYRKPDTMEHMYL